MLCSELENAVEVKALSKTFKVYKRPHHRILQLFASAFACLIKKKKKCYYSPYHSLVSVSVSIKKGESFGILGSNGAGKSTFLQLLCGTMFPDSGSVEINGRIAALLELGSGFNPEFTGRENVYLNASLLGLSKKEVDERYDAIVGFAEIREHINLPIKTYSSGMIVRLAFSVIAHVDADIIIVDEALAVGDAQFTEKCMSFFREFMTKGTLVFVSHDIGLFKDLCDRGMWLEKGIVRKVGDVEAVANAYASNLTNPAEDALAFVQK